MDEYYRAIRLLPSWLAGPLGQLPAQTAAQIHELRFRTGCGVFVTLSGRQLPLQDLPECPLQLRECVLDQFQIEEIFHTLCGGARRFRLRQDKVFCKAKCARKGGINPTLSK